MEVRRIVLVCAYAMLWTRTDSVMPTLATSSFGKMVVCMFGNRVKNLKKTITTVHEKCLTFQKVTNCKLLFKFEVKLPVITA